MSEPDDTTKLGTAAFAERMRARRGEPPKPVTPPVDQRDWDYPPDPETAPMPYPLPVKEQPRNDSDFVVLIGYFGSIIRTCSEPQVTAINHLTASFGITDPGDTRAHVEARLHRLAANPDSGKTFNMVSTIGALSVEDLGYLCVALGDFDMNMGVEERRTRALRAFEKIKKDWKRPTHAVRISTSGGPIDLDSGTPRHQLIRAVVALGMDEFAMRGLSTNEVLQRIMEYGEEHAHYPVAARATKMRECLGEFPATDPGKSPVRTAFDRASAEFLREMPERERRKR